MRVSSTYFKFGQSRSALLRKGQRWSLKNLETTNTESMTNCFMYLLFNDQRILTFLFRGRALNVEVVCAIPSTRHLASSNLI